MFSTPDLSVTFELEHVEQAPCISHGYTSVKWDLHFVQHYLCSIQRASYPIERAWHSLERAPRISSAMKQPVYQQMDHVTRMHRTFHKVAGVTSACVNELGTLGRNLDLVQATTPRVHLGVPKNKERKHVCVRGVWCVVFSTYMWCVRVFLCACVCMSMCVCVCVLCACLCRKGLVLVWNRITANTCVKPQHCKYVPTHTHYRQKDSKSEREIEREKHL